jgi:hypothetical protein
MKDNAEQTQVRQLHEALRMTLHAFVDRRRPPIDVIATVAASFAAEVVAGVSLAPGVNSAKFEALFFATLRKEIALLKSDAFH